MKYIEDFQISPIWDSELAIRGRKNIYNEIWVNHEYSRFGVEVMEGDVVVDCGANVGMFSQYAIYKGASKVFSYECGDENIQFENTDIEASKGNCLFNVLYIWDV